MSTLPGSFNRLKKGNRRAALLLHGMSSSPWEMSSLASALFKAGWDVYCPLLADFKEWEGRFGGFSWEYWFNAAQQVLSPLKGRYRRIVVIGTSLGGVLAGLLCARNPWVRSCVMVNPPFRYRGLLVHLVLGMRGIIKKIPIKIAAGYEDKYFPYFPVVAIRELGRLAKEVMAEAQKIRQSLLIYHTAGDRTVSKRGIDLFLRSAGSRHKEFKVVERGPHSLLAPYNKNNSIIFGEILRFIDTN